MVQQLPPGTRRLNSRVESGKSVWVYWECDGDRDVSRVAILSVGELFIETPQEGARRRGVEGGVLTTLFDHC